MKVGKYLVWTLFIFLAISVGLYPGVYYLSDVFAENGLLSQKPDMVREMSLWQFMFHTHIIMGGLSLLTGWSQFLKRFRDRNLNFHRWLGRVYLLAVLCSGVAGLHLAWYAEGGWVAKLGFGALAISWLYTSGMAYRTIRKKQIKAHKNWMIRSYALSFVAVTLRIWLPLFQFVMGMDFMTAYIIIAWLCWVPNMAWAEWKVRRLTS